MEKQTKDSICDTDHTGYLIVPKEEIIEDVEITYDGVKENMITPTDVSNSSLSDMADSDLFKLKPMKTDTFLSKGIAGIQKSGEVAFKGQNVSVRHINKDSLPKTSRKRNANFTPEEKALLTQLIKKRPIIQSKLTDGKSVMKKKIAWDLITKEFNSHAHVHQRNTNTLKRGWDNMKAVTRRVIVTVPRNSSKTGSESGQTMIEEVAPVCEVENSLDSDGTFHHFIVSRRSLSASNDEVENQGYLTDEKDSQDKSRVEFDSASQNGPFTHQPSTCQGTTLDNMPTGQPSDLMRREALVRIQHMKEKQNIEIEILKAQLETAESQKRAALIEEDRSRLRLEAARAELEKLKKIDIKMLYNNISNSNRK